MSLIDFILNLVGLMLWLNWRSVHLPTMAKPTVSLMSTLKRASPSSSRWLYFFGLTGLLLFRALIYWQLGPTVPWNPCIPLGPISLAFRSDLLGRMLFFSFLSFGASLALFYLWLLMLSCLNGRASDMEPQQRLVRLHLGLVESWSPLVKLLLPLVLMLGLWLAFHPLLAKLQIVPRTSTWHLLGQGAIIGLAVYLSLQFLVVGLLLLYLLHSYVYLGEVPFWAFINSTGRSILRPFQALPLRVGKIDLAPVVVIFLTLGIAWAMTLGLNRVYSLLAR